MNIALFIEIKNEYSEHLIETLTPYIYEGLTSIYREAVKIADETNNKDKTLLIFQKLLQSIDHWNQIRIDDETNRIKQLSRTVDYFDDLVKAVIKSNIILLAYSNTISNVIGQTFYNTFSTASFIHRCYTECGKDAHNNPYLFFHDIDPMDYKRNQIIIQQHIQSGITRAVRKILPISLILKEYLVNSINIIQEPTKIELLGDGGKVIDTQKIQQIDTIPIQPVLPNISENKIDERVEKAIINAIKSEGIKTDQQRLQTIMNIDKIIDSIEPKKIIEQKTSSSKKSTTLKYLSISKTNKSKESELILASRALSDNQYDDEIENENNSSNENIMNMKFDEESTIINSTSGNKSLSKTSMTNRGMPIKSASKYNLETSERIDPNKIQLIEDYGIQKGGRRYKKKI